MEPVGLSVANFEAGATPRVEVEPGPRPEPPPEVELGRTEPGQAAQVGPALADYLPLLGLLNGGGGDMSSLLAPLLKDKKVGGMEVASLLPIVMNSGLLGGRANNRANVPDDKFINLADYKRVN